MGSIEYIKTVLSSNKILIFILFLSLFFRYYHFWDLQYFQEDESIFYTILHKMVSEQSLVFVTPNATTGLHLGPFFHWLSLPLYIVFKGNPLYMGLVSPFIGMVTTLFIYLAGKEVSNKKLALLSAFIYASSFQISLHDRRYWTLGVNSLFISISLYSLLKIQKGHWIYLIPLVISMSFAWHSDFSLAVIPLSVLLSAFLVRKRPPLRYALPSFVYLLISCIPVVLFEIKHQLQILHVIREMLNRFQVSVESDLVSTVQLALTNYTRIFLTSATDNTEIFYRYDRMYPEPWAHPVSTVLLMGIIFWGVVQIINKFKAAAGGKIVLIYWVAFLIGNVYYSYRMGESFYQHYYMVIAPIIVLILSTSLLSIFQHSKTGSVAVIALLVLYLSLNTHALFYSRLEHPLYQKVQAAQAVKQLAKDGSIGYMSLDIKGGGMSYPLLHEGVKVVKSDSHDAWYWVFASYSLFLNDMQTDWPKKIYIFHDTDLDIPFSKTEIQRYMGDIDIIEINNASQTFDATYYKQLIQQ
jgi:4-amino-4-deoxy-L-arabinose transferase-like glycosyltransferase